MPTQVPVLTKEQVLGPILATYLLWTSIGCAVLAFLASIVVEHVRRTRGGAFQQGSFGDYCAKRYSFVVLCN
jgi:hypothetical protein